MELVIPDLGSFFTGSDGSLNLSIPTDSMLRIIRDKALKSMDVVGDELNIYQSVKTGRHGKAKFSKLSHPKHVLQSKKDCENWNPKGKMQFTPQEVSAYPYELMTEHCNDVFADCMRYVKGTGTNVNDITATREGRRLLGMMLSNLEIAIGNSIYDIVSFSNSDVITDSDTNSYYEDTTIPDDWTAFKDQQQATVARGHITQIEDLKAASDPYFTVPIYANDIANGKWVGGTTDGDVTVLFDRIKDSGSRFLRASVKNQRSNQAAIYLVSSDIFAAYEKYIMAQYSAIPAVLSYQLNRGGIIEPLPGVLRYKGHLVVCMDGWDEFDHVTGVTSHRVVLTVPGNLGVAYDVQALNQFDGAGLQIQVSPLIKEKGKAYMYTTLELGATIVDSDLMVNASLIVTP